MQLTPEQLQKLANIRLNLVTLQDVEQAKTFGAYDDERYAFICNAIDALDALVHALHHPDRVDVRGRHILTLAEQRFVRSMRRIDLPVS